MFENIYRQSSLSRLTLRERFGGHRANTLNFRCTNFFNAHYNSQGHSYSDMRVRILEKYPSENVLDQTEHFWIRTLQTAFPLGLNDSLRGLGNVSGRADFSDVRFLPYLHNSLPRRRRGNGRRRCNSRIVNEEFVDFEVGVNFNLVEPRVRFFRDLHSQSKKTIMKTIASIRLEDKHFSFKMSVFYLFFEGLI